MPAPSTTPPFSPAPTSLHGHDLSIHLFTKHQAPTNNDAPLLQASSILELLVPERTPLVDSNDIAKVSKSSPFSKEGMAAPVQIPALLLFSSPVAATVDQQHPSSKAFKPPKEPSPPDPPPPPPVLEATILSSPEAAAVDHQHPSPKVYELPEDAIPPDRKEAQLDEDIENTNDARGDHGCGLSGAQATAHQAVLKSNKEDGVKRINFTYPFRSSPCLPLSSARPLLPMPLVPTPPAQTVTQSNSQQNA